MRSPLMPLPSFTMHQPARADVGARPRSASQRSVQDVAAALFLLLAISTPSRGDAPLVAADSRAPAAVAPVVEAGAAATASDPAAAAALLARVAVIGASATSGFNVLEEVEIEGRTIRVPVDLGDVLACVRRDGEPPAVEAASFLFFTSPGPMGRTFAQRAAESSPSLVVAIDFLFWFGYGLVEGAETPARLALLDQGLALLDGFSCPIIVGDFPDMSDAVGKMLRREQMPSPEALKALNDRLRGWVEARRGAEKPVEVFSLSEFIEKVRASQPVVAGGATWPSERVGELLQGDRLHPTLEGLVATAFAVGELTERLAPGLDRDVLRRDPAAVRECVKAAAETKAKARAERGTASGAGEVAK